MATEQHLEREDSNTEALRGELSMSTHGGRKKSNSLDELAAEKLKLINEIEILKDRAGSRSISFPSRGILAPLTRFRSQKCICFEKLS